jgi:hypothetical protein
MLSRRALMMAGGSLALAAGPAGAAAVMTDDGFYREDWFVDSFLELEDDLKGAAAVGKQLAVNMGAARLSVLPGYSSDQFRAEGYRNLYPRPFRGDRTQSPWLPRRHRHRWGEVG